MKSTLPRCSLVLLAIAALWLTGCGHAKIVHLQSDPSFGDELVGNRVAVMPVVASTPLIGTEERIRLGELFINKLTTGEPDVRIASPDLVSNSLFGRHALRDAIDKYATTLTIDRATLTDLGRATGARYVAFLVIDEYSFGWQERKVEYKKVGAGDRAAAVRAGILLCGLACGGAIAWSIDERNEKGSVATRRAYATLAGTMSVFDSKRGRPVWVGAAVVSKQVELRTYVDRPIVVGDGPPQDRSEAIAQPPDLQELVPEFVEALLAEFP